MKIIFITFMLLLVSCEDRITMGIIGERTHVKKVDSTDCQETQRRYTCANTEVILNVYNDKEKDLK